MDAKICFRGEIGRHNGLKIHWEKSREGSTPFGSTNYTHVAQLVEQTAVNRWVVGPNPIVSAIRG